MLAAISPARLSAPTRFGSRGIAWITAAGCGSEANLSIGCKDTGTYEGSPRPMIRPFRRAPAQNRAPSCIVRPNCRRCELDRSLDTLSDGLGEGRARGVPLNWRRDLHRASVRSLRSDLRGVVTSSTTLTEGMGVGSARSAPARVESQSAARVQQLELSEWDRKG